MGKASLGPAGWPQQQVAAVSGSLIQPLRVSNMPHPEGCRPAGQPTESVDLLPSHCFATGWGKHRLLAQVGG